ncbi:hypothetical protein E2320_003510, partial [Naja naja]
AETPAEAWKPLECFQEPGKLSKGHFSLDYLFCAKTPAEAWIPLECSQELGKLIFSMDAQIFQTPAKLEVQEGSSFILKCNCSMQYRTYFWYHQLPGEPPSLTLSISSQEDHNSKGFVTKYLEKGKESQLHRPKAQFQDSGSYFCAVDAQ